MINFANAQAYASTMPAGTLVEASLTVEELRKSAAGNDFLNVRADVTSASCYAGRKIWFNLMLTQDGGVRASEIGSSIVRSIIETAGFSVETAPERFMFPDFQAVANAVHGATACIRVGVDKSGAKERNTVSRILSPNPEMLMRDLFDQLNEELCRDPVIWPVTDSASKSVDEMLTQKLLNDDQ